jgi:serine/threonine-protein kinase HipA
MAAIAALDVYQRGHLIGQLFDEHPLRFKYDATWMATPDAKPLANRLPLSVEDHSGDDVYAYFENLLPEGHIRRFLSVSCHATTVFGLLRSIGGDTAGDLTLMPEGEAPMPPSYSDTTWEQIQDKLNNRPVPAFAQEAEEARISLPGAQDKLLIMLRADGMPVRRRPVISLSLTFAG